MKDFNTGTLTIKVEQKDTLLIMSWIGKSIDRDPSATLNPYFDKILPEIEGNSLELHFANLEYMNSSTVPPIIKLVRQLNEKNISTQIFYNKDSEWQYASFKALGTIAQNLDNIDVTGK